MTFDWLSRARLGPLRGGGLWGSVIVVLAFLAISIPQYGAPYVIDEAVFPYVAAGIVKNGAPFFYNGLSNVHELGLWHPPLYDYLLSAQVKIWGMTPYAVRSFGAICVIPSFYFLALALKRIAPEIRQYGYVLLAALFLLNPLVISDSLVPDIDGTLGVIVVCTAIWLSTVVVQSELSLRLVIGVACFALFAVSTKFEIAAIVAFIVGGGALFARTTRWRKFLAVVVAFIVGAGVSLGLLFALGALLKFDARSPFDYLFGSLGSRPPGRSGLAGMILNLASGPGSNLVWIGPTVIGTALVSLLVIIIARPVGVDRWLACFTVGSALLILLGYSYITGSPYLFPKYTAVVVPGLAIGTTLIVTVLHRAGAASTAARTRRTAILSGLYVLVLLAAGAVTFSMASGYESSKPRALHELAKLAAVDFLGVAVATALLVYLLTHPPGTSGVARLRRPLLIGLAGALVFTPIIVQTSSSVVNLTSPFATRYYYRERGMPQFLAEAKRLIPRGAGVIAAKDVGLQIDRPFYEDASLLPLPPARLRVRLTQLNEPYLITRRSYDYSPSVYPKQFVVLREFYRPVYSPANSDFVLWKLK